MRRQLKCVWNCVVPTTQNGNCIARILNSFTRCLSADEFVMNSSSSSSRSCDTRQADANGQIERVSFLICPENAFKWMKTAAKALTLKCNLPTKSKQKREFSPKCFLWQGNKHSLQQLPSTLGKWKINSQSYSSICHNTQEQHLTNVGMCAQEEEKLKENARAF